MLLGQGLCKWMGHGWPLHSYRGNGCRKNKSQEIKDKSRPLKHEKRKQWNEARQSIAKGLRQFVHFYEARVAICGWWQRAWYNWIRRGLIPVRKADACAPIQPPVHIWHVHTERAEFAGGKSFAVVMLDLKRGASVISQCSLTSSPASIGWLRPRWTVSRIRTLAELAPTCSLCFCSHCWNKTILGRCVSI